MGNGTFYGNFMAKLKWKLFGNLNYHVFPDNIHANFTIKSPYKVSLFTLSPSNLHTISI